MHSNRLRWFANVSLHWRILQDYCKCITLHTHEPLIGHLLISYSAHIHNVNARKHLNYAYNTFILPLAFFGSRHFVRAFTWLKFIRRSSVFIQVNTGFAYLNPNLGLFTAVFFWHTIAKWMRVNSLLRKGGKNSLHLVYNCMYLKYKNG